MAFSQRWFPLLIMALVFGVLTVAAPRVVYACSCIAPGTPQQELAQADAVFGGTVTAINAAGQATFGGAARQVTFAVERVWKGALAARLTVITAASSASCGYEFQPGGEYLVYARQMEGGLTVSLCSRTQPTANAGEDLAALGPGQPPAAPVAAPSPGTGGPNRDAGFVPAPGALLLWGAVALALLGLLVATVLMLRRRADQDASSP